MGNGAPGGARGLRGPFGPPLRSGQPARRAKARAPGCVTGLRLPALHPSSLRERKLASVGAHCRRAGFVPSRDALETASRVTTKRAHDKAAWKTGDKLFFAFDLVALFAPGGKSLPLSASPRVSGRKMRTANSMRRRKSRPHPRRLVGVGAHSDRQLPVVAQVPFQHFGMAVEPAQARAIRGIERRFQRELPPFGEPRLDRGGEVVDALAGRRPDPAPQGAAPACALQDWRAARALPPSSRSNLVPHLRSSARRLLSMPSLTADLLPSMPAPRFAVPARRRPARAWTTSPAAIQARLPQTASRRWLRSALESRGSRGLGLALPPSRSAWKSTCAKRRATRQSLCAPTPTRRRGVRARLSGGARDFDRAPPPFPAGYSGRGEGGTSGHPGAESAVQMGRLQKKLPPRSSGAGPYGARALLV